MSSRNYYPQIDSLRFLLAIGIVIFHFLRRDWASLSNVIDINGLFIHVADANKIVDFFFIISGFFLFKHFDSTLSFKNFIFKKLVRLWPVMAFSFILLWVAHRFNLLAFNNEVTLSYLFLTAHVFYDVPNIVLNAHWYTVVLFWVSLFYFAIYKYFGYRKVLNLLIAIIVFFSYRILLNSNLDLASFSPTGILLPGVLRGMGGMGIGFFLALFNYEKENSSMSRKLISSLLEVFFAFILVKYLFFPGNHPIKYSFFLIITFILEFILLVKGEGILAKFLAWNKLAMFGKYAFCVFSLHQLVNELFEKYIVSAFASSALGAIACTFLVIFCTLCASVITYHFVEKPITSIFKNYLK